MVVEGREQLTHLFLLVCLQNAGDGLRLCSRESFDLFNRSRDARCGRLFGLGRTSEALT